MPTSPRTPRTPPARTKRKLDVTPEKPKRKARKESPSAGKELSPAKKPTLQVINLSDSEDECGPQHGAAADDASSSLSVVQAKTAIASTAASVELEGRAATKSPKRAKISRSPATKAPSAPRSKKTIEQELIEFDLDHRWGPACGMDRLERWQRAEKFNLDPGPRHVRRSCGWGTGCPLAE
eukprot:GEMP01098836.1.p1 GENE.GEMP01098836.1~~GEMP01098836.1.p1  ORF type:complete len:181 (+),score=42.88 GEMP01098836.1:135-677(+)